MAATAAYCSTASPSRPPQEVPAGGRDEWPPRKFNLQKKGGGLQAARSMSKSSGLAPGEACEPLKSLRTAAETYRKNEDGFRRQAADLIAKADVCSEHAWAFEKAATLIEDAFARRQLDE